MKQPKSIVDQRRNNIMLELQKDGKVTVDDLAEKFDVSKLTIRRDLQHWEDQGALERFHGGARLVTNMIKSDDPAMTNIRHKQAIAKCAASFVEDGDTIFINSSSTALLVVKYIKNKRVTVITNNGKAIFCEHEPQVTIVLTGGELRIIKESMVGDMAITALNKIKANKCFVGCGGIEYRSGMTTAIFSEVAVNNLMLKNCTGTTFVLADYTKVGNVHSFVSGSIDKIDYLITDTLADENELDLISDTGVRVVQLEPLIKVE